MRKAELIFRAGWGLVPVGAAFIIAAADSDEMTADPLFRVGIIVIGVGFISGIIALLLRVPKPRLKVRIPKQYPLRPRGLNDLIPPEGDPIVTDFRLRGGMAGTPVSHVRVDVLRLPVFNVGSVRAEGVRAEITQLPPMTVGEPTRRGRRIMHPGSTIPLQWRRDVAVAKYEASIPPRDGREDVCLVEWESYGSGSRTVYPPAGHWRGPVKLTVVVSAPDVKPIVLKLKIEGIQADEGTPRVVRLRWWNRRD